METTKRLEQLRVPILGYIRERDRVELLPGAEAVIERINARALRRDGRA